MAHLIELDGIRPTIGVDVFLAPTAVLIGDVHVGDRSSVWSEMAVEDHQALRRRYLAPGRATVAPR